MPQPNLHSFARPGSLALRADVFGMLMLAAPAAVNVEVDGAVIVDVTGPLEHRAGGMFDSYEAIRERFDAACVSSAPVVILKIDSPGGEVAGCFEAVRDMRARAAAAGKRVLAYVDGQACSAGYALACAAERIVCGEASMLGSIGVIHTALETTAADAMAGVRFTVTTSGARKADGHPHVAADDGMRASFQAHVDALAGVFFGLVREFRPAVGDPAALQAAVLVGQTALAAGLADAVAPFDVAKLVASLTPDTIEQPAAIVAAPEITPMTLAEIKAALAALAEAGGDDAAAAQKMLDATAEAAPPLPPPADDEQPPPSEPAPDAKCDPDEKMAAEVAARSALLASRSDLTPELRAMLASMPTDRVTAFLAALPVPKSKAAAPASPADVINARGIEPAGTAPSQSPEANALDRSMGLVRYMPGVKHEGNVMFLGAPIAAGKDS